MVFVEGSRLDKLEQTAVQRAAVDLKDFASTLSFGCLATGLAAGAGAAALFGSSLAPLWVILITMGAALCGFCATAVERPFADKSSLSFS